MMREVGGHVVALQGLKMSSSHDTRRERAGGVEQQLVHQRVPAAQDHGQEGTGIEIPLDQGMEFGEDLQAHRWASSMRSRGTCLLVVMSQRQSRVTARKRNLLGSFQLCNAVCP